MGPFGNEKEFYEHLFGPASTYGFKLLSEYEETLFRAKKLQRPYRIMFTHGDFKAHNVLVGDDGIYPVFSTGNPQAGILNNGSLQHQCGLDKTAGGSRRLLGSEGINILRN